MDNKEIKFQEKCDAFVERNVYINQTSLVCDLLEKGHEDFSWDLVESLYDYYPEGEFGEEELPEPPEAKEIFQWWIVSSGLIKELEKRNEPILKNISGTWWGRTTCGQAISMDQVIRDIVKGE